MQCVCCVSCVVAVVAVVTVGCCGSTVFSLHIVVGFGWSTVAVVCLQISLGKGWLLVVVGRRLFVYRLLMVVVGRRLLLIRGVRWPLEALAVIGWDRSCDYQCWPCRSACCVHLVSYVSLPVAPGVHVISACCVSQQRRGVRSVGDVCIRSVNDV